MLAPDTLTGPVITTRYVGPTNCRPSRVIATHKRDNGTTWRATVAWDHALNSEQNHSTAAAALLAAWPYVTDLRIVARGHDAAAFYWLAVSPWQLVPAAYGAAAAAELEAITAGAEPADPADPLALPLALARIATGTARPESCPLITGWREHRGGLTLTGPTGADLLTLPDTVSPAGGLAAAEAAGWMLTAPMRATAARLRNVCGAEPDPAAVAAAVAALGGCPAVIATLSAKGVA